jgi:hypothetical protein
MRSNVAPQMVSQTEYRKSVRSVLRPERDLEGAIGKVGELLDASIVGVSHTVQS